MSKKIIDSRDGAILWKKEGKKFLTRNHGMPYSIHDGSYSITENRKVCFFTMCYIYIQEKLYELEFDMNGHTIFSKIN